MAADPEARTQLARLLGDASLRNASVEMISETIEARLSLLVDGLATEAASSDDVSNGPSALDFLHRRLDFFEGLISEDQRTRLLQALWAKIEAW